MSQAVPNPLIVGLMASLLQRPTPNALSDQYLIGILNRERVDEGPFSPVHIAHRTLQPIISAWAGTQLSHVGMSGSFAKGTANRSGTDIDLLLSLWGTCTTSLRECYLSLRNSLIAAGYHAEMQNVSIGVRVGGTKVDLVPARQQGFLSSDHSIYHKRSGNWRKTNIQTHVNLVRNCGHTNVIRLLKLWRDQRGLEFPSFYLELATIKALNGGWYGTLSQNVLRVLDYLAGDFVKDRFFDPANRNNAVSDDLTSTENADPGCRPGQS